jgi:acid phosphatase
MATICALAVAAGVFAGCGGSAPRRDPTTSSVPGAPSSPVASPVAVPRPEHVVVVVMENRSYGDIMGNGSAPYINALASRGARFTQSFAVTHPSQPNYLALFSGSTQGVTGDSCPHTFATPNLAASLVAHGLTFVGFSEGLPSTGDTVCTAGAYARKHNPWSDFRNVTPSANRPFTAFPSDYSTLPTVSFVIPDLNHDMHDGSITAGDRWLSTQLGGYAAWASTHRSLLVLTWDEDDGGPYNRILTVVVGDGVRAGAYAEHVDHYRVLRTIEDAFGLPPIGASASAPPITDIWTG